MFTLFRDYFIFFIRQPDYWKSQFRKPSIELFMLVTHGSLKKMSRLYYLSVLKGRAFFVFWSSTVAKMLKIV